MRRDEVTLRDMVEACRAIAEFIHWIDRETFLEDRKTRSATFHQLFVLGEATKRLSEGFRSRHQEFPWSSMAGMRNVLIHSYDQVDLELPRTGLEVSLGRGFADSERPRAPLRDLTRSSTW